MEDLMFAKDAAEYFQVHVTTLYRWSKQGFIPYTRLGKNYIFSRRLLNLYLTDKMGMGGSENENGIATENA